MNGLDRSEEIESLKAQLRLAESMHDVAVKERDLARTQITLLRVETEQALSKYTSERDMTMTKHSAYLQELEQSERTAYALLEEASAALRGVAEYDTDPDKSWTLIKEVCADTLREIYLTMDRRLTRISLSHPANCDIYDGKACSCKRNGK